MSFIRAPRIRSVGEGVEVLATRPDPAGGEPVLVRQGNVVAATFHPELTDDDRVQRLAFENVLSAAGGAVAGERRR